MLINCLPRVLGCPVILVTQRLSLIKPQLTAIKRRSALAKTERSCTHGFFRPSPPARWLPPGVGRRTSRAVFSSGLAALISLVLTTAPAAALDEKSGEKAQLKTCEKSFCNIILGKDGSKPADFQCLLSKTWAKSKIKENVDGKTTAWSLGDARCGATVTLPRQAILESKDAGKHVIQFAPHTVRCEVEKGTAVTVINVTLAPKIQFRNGNAEKAWINLKNVDGPPTLESRTVDRRQGRGHARPFSERRAEGDQQADP